MKKPITWFCRRIGKEIVIDNSLSLFEPPVKIASKNHAKALHANQDKGHRYSDTIKPC